MSHALKCAWEKLEVVPLSDALIEAAVDHAVAVEQDRSAAVGNLQSGMLHRIILARPAG
jgi:hypothetical protein